ncbi:redoxin domain-containing protein [Candidatus Poribacteria bacterium]|nr:redoxin domain-containing protein [Candidatus Poribacteria bacterium]
MRIKFINQLVYIALIFSVLMCFGCLETDEIADVLTPDPQDTNVMTPEPPMETTPEPEPLDPGEGLAIGATAPAFSLPDADGNTVMLSDYAGQKVVIQFYSTGL